MKGIQAFIVVAIFVFLSSEAGATVADIQDYDWKELPNFEVPEVLKDEHEIVLQDKRILEYGFENDYFLEYYLQHKIIYVVTDNGVENNNKIYVPSAETSMMLINKARVMTSSKKIIELEQSDIKEARDEETGQVYNYFALEGLDEGSFVEFLYLSKRIPTYKGSSEVLQSTMRKKNTSFELIAPKHLYFAFKSTNGLPEMERDTNETDKNVWKVQLDLLPALKWEPVAANRSNMMATHYKLKSNTASSSFDIASYGDFSKSYYKAIYEGHSKSDIKKIGKLIKDSGAEKGSSADEKVRLLENYVKTNFGLVTSNQPDLSVIGTVLEKKLATRLGMVRIFGVAFNQMGISHQIMLTCNRFSQKFDPEFEGNHFLQKIFIYFPEAGTYMDPTGITLRYGYISSEYTNHHGLFIKPVKIGDITTGIGKVKFVKPLSYDKSIHHIFLSMDLSDDPVEPELVLENHIGGYQSEGIQTLYSLLAEDQQDEVIRSLVDFIFGGEEPEELTVENTDPADFGQKPMVIKTKVKTGEFVEKAGEKYLIRVGALIGEQVEMYEEDKRVQKVEEDYNRHFYREIALKMPENFAVSNLDVLNIEVSHGVDDETKLIFVSSYEVNGNEVKITINEYYKQIDLPVEAFEEYKAVVNAAADFNKVVLFMEPIK